jgi:hypothetical protein
MTDRLDRIENALLQLTDRALSTDARLVRLAEQAEATNARLNRLASIIEANETTNQKRHVETMETVELVSRGVEAAVGLARENSDRITVLLEDARADRQHSKATFTQILERADLDRTEQNRRWDAQREITQAMLLELSTVNRRLQQLETAA